MWSAKQLRVSILSTEVLLVVLLGGCRAVGPNCKLPEVPTPDAWHQEVTKEINAETPQLQAWWTQFNDPVLEDLIRRSRAQPATDVLMRSRVRTKRFVAFMLYLQLGIQFPVQTIDSCQKAVSVASLCSRFDQNFLSIPTILG